MKQNSIEGNEALSKVASISEFSSSVRTIANNNINKKIKFLDQSDRTCSNVDFQCSKGSRHDFYEAEISYMKEEMHIKNMEIASLKSIIYENFSFKNDQTISELLNNKTGKIRMISYKKIVNDFHRSKIKIKNKLRLKAKKEKDHLKKLKENQREIRTISIELDSIIENFLNNESHISMMQKNSEIIMKEIQSLFIDKKRISEGFEAFIGNIEGYLVNYAEKLKIFILI